MDFSRGILIFLVLWGHSIQYLSYGSFDFFEDKVFTVIYSFHMPLFMLLSGYVFFWTCRKRSYWQIIVERLKGLGLPMLSWGVVQFAWSSRNWDSVTLMSLLRQFVNSIFYTTWFLWAVLFASVLTGAMYFCKKRERMLFLFLSGVLVYILPVTTMNLFMIPYFIAGFMLNASGVSEQNLHQNATKVLSVVLWAVMLFFFQKKHYVYVSGILPFHSEYGFWGQIQIDFFRYSIGGIGCVAVLSVLQSAYQRIRHLPFVHSIERYGRCSLKIYVMQIFLLERLVAGVVRRSVAILGTNYFTKNILVFDFVVTVVCAVLCCAVLMAIAELIKKNKTLHFVLFGKCV